MVLWRLSCLAYFRFQPVTTRAYHSCGHGRSKPNSVATIGNMEVIMRVAVLFTVLAFVLTSVGCASHQRCEQFELCYKVQAPPIQSVSERIEQPIWQELFSPSNEVRAARLRLLAAIVLIGGEIALEVIKASN